MDKFSMREIDPGFNFNTVSSWRTCARWQPQNHRRQNPDIQTYPINDNKLR